MKTKLRILILILSCACLSSCVVRGDSRAMVPAGFSPGRQFKKTVNVVVTGGQTPSMTGVSLVTNENLAAAVESAIGQSGLFSQVVRSGTGDYQLDVRLIQLDLPTMGFNMTGQAEIEWRLKQSATGRLIWQKITNTPYTATVGQAFVGAKRARFAAEGTVRENIKAALEQIAALSL